MADKVPDKVEHCKLKQGLRMVKWAVIIFKYVEITSLFM